MINNLTIRHVLNDRQPSVISKHYSVRMVMCNKKQGGESMVARWCSKHDARDFLKRIPPQKWCGPTTWATWTLLQSLQSLTLSPSRADGGDKHRRQVHARISEVGEGGTRRPTSGTSEADDTRFRLDMSQLVSKKKNKKQTE